MMHSGNAAMDFWMNTIYTGDVSVIIQLILGLESRVGTIPAILIFAIIVSYLTSLALQLSIWVGTSLATRSISTLKYCASWTRWRRQLRVLHPNTEQVIQAKGIVYRGNGAYICLDVNRTNVLVPVTSDMGASFIAAHQTAPPVYRGNLEMSMPNSRPVSCQTPKWLVGIYKDDRVIGVGSRVRIEGETYLLTAAHVLASHRDGRIELGKGLLRLPFARDWKMVSYSRIMDLDYALVRVPPTVWSLLQVGCIDMGRATAGLVTIYGYGIDGEVYNSTGILEKSKEFRLKHYASTEPGYSGSPLIYNGKVVGVHTGHSADRTHNEATTAAIIMGTMTTLETPFIEGSYKRVLPGEVDKATRKFTIYGPKGMVDYAVDSHYYAIMGMREGHFTGKSWADEDWESMDFFDEDPDELFIDRKESSYSPEDRARMILELRRRRAETPTRIPIAVNRYRSVRPLTPLDKYPVLEPTVKEPRSLSTASDQGSVRPVHLVNTNMSQAKLTRKESAYRLSEEHKASASKVNNAAATPSQAQSKAISQKSKESHGPQKMTPPSLGASPTKQAGSNGGKSLVDMTMQVNGSVVNIRVPPESVQALSGYGWQKQTGKTRRRARKSGKKANSTSS